MDVSEEHVGSVFRVEMFRASNRLDHVDRWQDRSHRPPGDEEINLFQGHNIVQ
jgi:hypothetical protein